MGRRARAQAAIGPCLLDFLLYDRARATRIQTSGPCHAVERILRKPKAPTSLQVSSTLDEVCWRTIR